MAQWRHWVQKNWTRFLRQVPADLQPAFEEECARKNLTRLALLTFINMFAQIFCAYFYLSFYPKVYPDNLQLNESFYLSYSLVYLVFNLVMAVVLLVHRRRSEGGGIPGGATLAIGVFLLGYTILESIQVGVEVEISGNMYRLLASFGVVAFASLVTRRKRISLMLLYLLVAEMVLYMVHQSRGAMLHYFAQIIFGVFLVCAVAANFFYSSVIRTFLLHAEVVESNRKLQALNETLERLSVTDPLTGVSNRRALSDYADRSWRTGTRGNEPISLLMIDIDYFKRFNDAYGHQAGDDCLIQVAATIQSNFKRASDMTARYGGEEFSVLLPHMPVDRCRLVAELVRQGVEALGIGHEGNPTTGVVTVSIGVASKVPVIGETYESLIKLADDALYEAKHTGRNCVVFADMEPEE